MGNRRSVKIEHLIPYGHQWIDEKDIKEVVKVLKSDRVTQGPKVEEFEKAVAEYCGVKYGVAVSSGTAALQAAYEIAGIKQGDEVVTTPMTFAATAYTLMQLGGKPVFVDIRDDTLNIDPKFIEGQINSKTKAIAPVDFAGHPCDYDEIIRIARKHNLLIIEDAAHALGSEYKGKRIGAFADLTTLSFHPVKTITTGEGGMVLTNNKDFYEKLKIFRSHGAIKKPEKGGWYYEIENPSYNFRITDFQCALGLSQLKKIGKFIKRRREIAKIYNRSFKNIKEIITPTEKDYVKSAWHIYPLQVKLNRKKIFEALKREGLGVQVHYLPIHLQPFYQKKYGSRPEDFPVAKRYYERAITLPLFPKMTDGEVRYVVETVKKIIKNNA